MKKNKGAAEVNDISNQNRIPKPPGYVIFKDLTVDQLNLFRVIPENAKDAYDLIIPLNNKIYETDGLYTTNWSDGEYWYKIAGGKFIEINVTASTIYFKDVTFILSIANIISSHGFQPLENHHWTYNPFDTRPKTY